MAIRLAPRLALAASAVLLLLLAFLAPSAQAIKAVAVSKDHPIGGVIDLLKRLESKAEEDGKQEEVLYAKFEHWCRNSQKTLEKAISAAKAKLEKLADEIESGSGNIAVLEKEIAALGGKLVKLAKADDAADSDRKAGENLYNAEDESLGKTVTAIENAIALLEGAKKDTEGWLLAQKSVRTVLALVSYRATQGQMQVLRDFGSLSAANVTRPELKAEGDYEDHVDSYTFKSQSVIEMLKDLRLKFQDEREATTKAETNALNAYNLAKQARGEVRTATQATKQVKEGELDMARGDLATVQLDYNNTRDDKNSDTGTLATTDKSCSEKDAEWRERSEMRGKEREAIEVAIRILAKVGGVRTEAPSNPIPPTSPVSFLQLGNLGPRTKKAITLLRGEARAVHSKALEELASAVEQHGDGPFDQVVNMIQKMIYRLMHEQTEEDEHKDWCDQALSKTQKSIDDKKDKVDELTAKVDDAIAQAASLLEDMNAADDMVAKIQAHVQEATEIRKIGKQQNALSIKDAEDAQTALANAIAVLKDHYKESGEVQKEAWEFIQSRRAGPVALSKSPATWDSSYTSVADPEKQPQGILAVLEQVTADFAQMESETAAQEASDKEIYDEDVKNCAIEKARRRKESEAKGEERKRQLEKQKTLELERKGVRGELEATHQYMKDLQPACVEAENNSTYEDRKAARASEIEALKSAQGLLQNAFEDTPEEPAEVADPSRNSSRSDEEPVEVADRNSTLVATPPEVQPRDGVQPGKFLRIRNFHRD